MGMNIPSLAELQRRARAKSIREAILNIATLAAFAFLATGIVLFLWPYLPDGLKDPVLYVIQTSSWYHPMVP